MKTVCSSLKLAIVTLALFGCEELGDLTDLEVPNENDPDRERLLAEAAEVEQLIGGSFPIWLQSTYHANPAVTLAAAADEQTAYYRNFGALQTGQEPREEWPNSSTFNWRAGIENPWHGNYVALSSVYDGLLKIQRDSLDIADQIDIDRATAFSRFIQGLAHGFLALMFDSAWVLDETVDIEVDTLVRVPYPDVMDAALSYFDEAIGIATGASWRLDPQWIRGNAFTADELIGLIHGFKARYMSQIARTPAERAAIDWTAVIHEVDQNLGRDFLVEGDGWTEESQWYNDAMWIGNYGRHWSRTDYKTIGYTDTSGRYSAWLRTSLGDRDQFAIHTPDARIRGDPNDSTVAGTDFRYEPATWPSDPLRPSYLYASYVQDKYYDYIAANGWAYFKLMSDTVQQLIKAEGLYHTGNPDGAAAIVNITRVGRGNLPPTSGSDPELYDKLRYEVSIENHNVCSGCAYFNRRGWGPLVSTHGDPPGTHHWGLVEGTPLHFPMPAVELEVLQQTVYTYGGVGNEGEALGLTAAAPASAAPRGGVPAWLVYRFDGLDTAAEKLEYIRTQVARGPMRGALQLIRH